MRRDKVSHHGVTCGRHSHLQSGKGLQGAGDARHRFESYTWVCEQADNKADSVPCEPFRDKSIILCLLAALLLFFSDGLSVCQAGSTLFVRVEVIQAERDGDGIDPGLEDLARELSPVLNYTSFALQKKSEIRLGQDEKEEILLPSGRTLELSFLGFTGKQARLQVRILENGRETFRTVVLLVDQGHVLIGGPPQERGVLLLRISGDF